MSGRRLTTRARSWRSSPGCWLSRWRTHAPRSDLRALARHAGHRRGDRRSSPRLRSWPRGRRCCGGCAAGTSTRLLASRETLGAGARRHARPVAGGGRALRRRSWRASGAAGAAGSSDRPPLSASGSTAPQAAAWPTSFRPPAHARGVLAAALGAYPDVELHDPAAERLTPIRKAGGERASCTSPARSWCSPARPTSRWRSSGSTPTRCRPSPPPTTTSTTTSKRPRRSSSTSCRSPSAGRAEPDCGMRRRARRDAQRHEPITTPRGAGGRGSATRSASATSSPAPAQPVPGAARCRRPSARPSRKRCAPRRRARTAAARPGPAAHTVAAKGQGATAHLRAMLAGFDQYAGRNHWRVVGHQLPGLWFLGSDGMLRRRRFDRRLASGRFAAPRRNVVTPVEVAGLLKPPTVRCRAPNVIRSGGVIAPAARATLPTFTGQPRAAAARAGARPARRPRRRHPSARTRSSATWPAARGMARPSWGSCSSSTSPAAGTAACSWIRTPTRSR